MDESARPRPGPGAAESGETAGEPAVPPAPAVPAVPSEPAGPPRHTRRWVLAGALAILAGGGAGVGAAFRRHRAPHRPPAAPQLLVSAAEAERRLIDDLVATTGGTPDVRAVIEQATANHRSHLATLEALLGRYRAPATAPSRVPGAPRTKAQLRAAEHSASGAAAGRALRLAGPDGALFASIAACEATHAELLR